MKTETLFRHLLSVILVEKRFLSYVPVAVAIFLAASAHAGVITDGDFSAWSFGATGTATVTRELSGGNTGERLNITTVSGPAVYGTAIKSDFSSTSALAGAPFTLTVDVLSGPGAFGQGQAIQLLVEQNGSTYGTLGLRDSRTSVGIH